MPYSDLLMVSFNLQRQQRFEELLCTFLGYSDLGQKSPSDSPSHDGLSCDLENASVSLRPILSHESWRESRAAVV